MSATEYDVGDRVTIQATFTDENSVLTDPDTVQLEIKNPAGTVTTPSVSNPSTGVYEGSVLFDADGLWWYRWEGTGTVDAAEEGSMSVRESQFP